jgi:hypothetical protein
MSDSIAYIEENFTRLVPGDDRFESWRKTVRAYQKEQIPSYSRFEGDYFPIGSFKHVSLISAPKERAEKVFSSSGTLGEHTRSRHYVRSLAVYERSVMAGFERAYGSGKLIFLAHLPHYESTGSESSLVYMASVLMRAFGIGGSGFFLDDHSLLEEAVERSVRSGTPILLLGAAFGLLDLIEAHSWRLPSNAVILETGGMKTHRREISRDLLHESLARGFGVRKSNIGSEYGMCELLSQCYTRSRERPGRVFYPPPWMSFEVLDPSDPDRRIGEGREGVLAVTDLANVHSVSSLQTEDLVIGRGDGFEVIGRLRQADLRGCNFLLEA